MQGSKNIPAQPPGRTGVRYEIEIVRLGNTPVVASASSPRQSTPALEPAPESKAGKNLSATMFSPKNMEK